MNDQELKIKCIELAIDCFRKNMNEPDIIKTAGEYYQFVKETVKND